MPAPLSSGGRGPMKVMESRTTMHTKSSHEAGLLQRILPVIRRRALFSPGDSILVAVSGGLIPLPCYPFCTNSVRPGI